MKKIFLVLAMGLAIASCSKDDSNPETNNPESQNPATEHHDNDGIKDNGDGSSGVTLGNVGFTTTQRDFSGEPVVTDHKTVSAKQVGEYFVGGDLHNFRINGNHIIAFEKISAFTSKILVYNMDTKKVTDEFTPDSYLVGMDFNGAIMTVEGSEFVNFYKVDGDKVQKHFFHIKGINDSKFLSECYLDHNRAYIYNTDEILYFDLDNATVNPKPRAMKIGDFSQVRFTSDEKYLYVSEGDYNSSKIYLYNKAASKIEKTIKDVPVRISGITVDANYIYYADAKGNKIHVINKHNNDDSGIINITSPEAIDLIGDNLYVFDSSSQKIIKYKVSFN